MFGNMLLHWGILEPQGPSANLAAIRFSAPVHVQSIRIFPTGCTPFMNAPDVVAHTEPPTMYLDVFFNAQPMTGADGKPKQKPSNALIPTTLAYAGGMAEFPLDMGSEFTTRLMIVRGPFQYLSLAVYGTTVVVEDPSSSTYEPMPLPIVEYPLLPPSLDPSNSIDPTILARSLLPSSDAPISLELITRLMFCLKPANEDWEQPAFPHLYSDLEEFNDRPSVAYAVEVTARPTSDKVEVETLKAFASNVADVFDPENDEHVQSFARLLSQCAPQNLAVIHALLEHTDVQRMFDRTNLDRLTLLDLLDACANSDISRHVGGLPQIMRALESLRDGHGGAAEVRLPAKQIVDLIRGWDIFEDALTNTQAQFQDATVFLEQITVDEMTFGTWLLAVTTNRRLVDKLSDNPVSIHPLPHPPSLWTSASSHSHENFIAFVRALIGVAAVIAVYAWSDSVPLFETRAKALSLLRLWQNVNGYREIVNHLLLIRQMTLRLECMLVTEDAPPTQEGIDAEHILWCMAMQPKSFLRSEFVKVMQDLKSPLNFLMDDVVTAFNRVAEMANGGVSAALKLIQKSPEDLDGWGKMLDLRVAVAVINEKLRGSPDGEYRVVRAAWNAGLHDVSIYLIKHTAALTSELLGQFSLAVPSRKAQADVAGLFKSCDSLLRLLQQLLPAYPVSQRHLTTLVTSIADVFICSDSADMTFAQSSETCTAAHVVRQTCINVMVMLSSAQVEGGKPYATAINSLKALLRHASEPGEHDATHHMMQTFWLFDHTLPMQKMEVDGTDSVPWTRQVMPHLLEVLLAFYCLQEADNKSHLIKRFMALDNDVVGIAEWFLLEEINSLRKTLFEIKSTYETMRRSLCHWRITSSLKVLASLVEGSSSASAWTTAVLAQNDSETGIALTTCLGEIIEQELYYSSLSAIGTSLSAHLIDFPPDLRRILFLILLRVARGGVVLAFNHLATVLSSDAGFTFHELQILKELGYALESLFYEIQQGGPFPTGVAESVNIVLSRLFTDLPSASKVTLDTLRQDSFEGVIQWLTESVSANDALESIKSKATAVSTSATPYTHLPAMDLQTVTFSLIEWETLLSPPPPVPSTPKRRSPAQTAEVLGLVTISPPNALLRSPEVKGLTKTYANNDFRQLRQSTTTRQNTSRLPSTHVDDFELAGVLASTSSPPAAAGPLFGSPPRPSPHDVLRNTMPMHPMNFSQ